VCAAFSELPPPATTKPTMTTARAPTSTAIRLLREMSEPPDRSDRARAAKAGRHATLSGGRTFAGTVIRVKPMAVLRHPTGHSRHGARGLSGAGSGNQQPEPLVTPAHCTTRPDPRLGRVAFLPGFVPRRQGNDELEPPAHAAPVAGTPGDRARLWHVRVPITRTCPALFDSV
jgi:hypothetical protein